MPRRIIWTQTAYDLLYEQLISRFGPHTNWTTAKPEGYKQFCDTFAELVRANSGDAVDQQIQFALGVKRKAHWSQGHFFSAVRNMAAAYNAGFIDYSYFPRSVTATNDREVVVHETPAGQQLVFHG